MAHLSVSATREHRISHHFTGRGPFRASRHDAADPSAPIPMFLVPCCVARGHHALCPGPGEDLSWWAPLGVGSAPPGPSHRVTRGSGPRGVVAYREHRDLGRGETEAHRGSWPVRRSYHDRGRRARLAAYSLRRQVCDGDHRSDPGARETRPGPAAGHGRGPLETGISRSGAPLSGVARGGQARRSRRKRGHRVILRESSLLLTRMESSR